MSHLLKHLKPFIWMILIAIVLLFVQANSELSLPDFLSRIVNVGIQQGGVENAVPVAIRQNRMEEVTLLLSDTDRERVLQSYTLVTPGSTESQAWIKQYPALSTEAVYIRKDVDDSEMEWLNTTMTRALLVTSGIERAFANPDQAAIPGFDISAFPAGTNPFDLLKKAPPEMLARLREQINTAMDSQLKALGENMAEQTAIQVVKAEYTALGMDMTALQTGYILRIGGKMLLITLLAVASAIGVGFFASRTAAGFGRDVRRAVFEKVESFANAEFDRFSTASLITRSTNDVTQIQQLTFMLIRMVFFAPIMGIGGIIRALEKDSSMWWLIAVAVAILLVVILVLFTFTMPKFKLMQKLTDRINLVTREQLSGMMVIRAFNRQDFEHKRFDQTNAELADTGLFINRAMSAMFPTMTLIMNGLSVMIIWIGAHQVAQSTLQVGDMMAFMQYAMQIVFSFLMMSFMFIILPRALVSVNRVAEVLNTEPSITDKEKTVHFPEPFRGEVSFNNVSFRYPDADENVICSINFTAKPGQMTAFIGSTGSGKSTLINLIPRFYDVTEGSITIDGVDIRDVPQQELRKQIGYIPQKGILFSGTVESNLKFGDEKASPEDLQHAVTIAQARSFIQEDGQGFEREIAQGGANVSGGQKQRLTIARALVKKAPIYIFDDSFSALDFKTDAELRKALKEHTSSSTILIVTQRVSTILQADQIIVLEDGDIVGKGTHKELMKTCQTYREIALSQLSLEELS
ncbi:MAG TPA: ABC transporter ATP-binding protein [Anaerolineaceae bacterium]|nr:ABC transporter ATP-binding protein [Anaerolineaceae bacterium]